MSITAQQVCAALVNAQNHAQFAAMQAMDKPKDRAARDRAAIAWRAHKEIAGACAMYFVEFEAANDEGEPHATA